MSRSDIYREAFRLEDRVKELEADLAAARAEVLRLRSAEQHDRMFIIELKAEIVALHQRHAEAVEAAADLLETAVVLAEPCVMTHSTHDCTNCDWRQRADAWLASEAKKGGGA